MTNPKPHTLSEDEVKLALETKASTLLEFLESDFGQSGSDVRFMAIRDELEGVYQLATRAAYERAAMFVKDNPHYGETLSKQILALSKGDQP